MKIYKHDAGHMTRMADMPIFSETSLKIFFPRNQWNDFSEAGYVASVSPVHHSLFI